MKRRILSALLACCMTLALCPAALAAAVIADPDDEMNPGDTSDDSGYTFILNPEDVDDKDPGDTSKSDPGDTTVPAPAPTPAPVLDDSLAALLDDYFGTFLTRGPAVYNCDFDDFLDWMSPDVLENAVIRVEGLSEQEKALSEVTFDVQTFYPETGELYVDVTEKTVDGDEFLILHTLRVSGDADSGWYIESDEYGDPLIHDLLSAEFNAGAVPQPSGSHPNTWTNTGDQARDIVEIALTQEGYAEVGDNRTKYNVWFYGKNVSAAWCAIFISWCANQAGIPTSIIKKNALASYFSTSNMRRNSFGTSTAFAFGSDTPRPGDIAYIDVDNDGVSNHVGLVYAVDGGYVRTIEGNTSNKAMRHSYSASTGRMGSRSTKIVFFARPSYRQNRNDPPPESTLTITTAQNSYRIEQGTPCDVRGTVRSNYSLTSARATISTLGNGWTATLSGIGRTALNIGASRLNDFEGARLSVGTHTLTIEATDSGGKTVRKEVPIEVYSRDNPVNPDNVEMPPDVRDPSAYYYYPVRWGVRRNIVSSTPPFRPMDDCTRADAVMFLWRLAGSPTASVSNPFTDVHPSDEYYSAVLWAVSRGITQGKTATTFVPSESCNRGQIVTFLHRYAGTPSVSTSSRFPDVGPDRFCYASVNWASAHGVTEGFSDGTFKPARTCNRAQIITFLHRYAGD